MSDNLEQLGPNGFQNLAAALLISSFGPGWHAMGAGKDGGRDLYHRGRLAWTPQDADGDTWDGYTVAQVKHHAKLASKPTENATWLWARIREELNAWSDPSGTRGEVPDYLIIVTNVALTPVAAVGGHDQIDKAFKTYFDELNDSSRDLDVGGQRSTRRRKLAKLQGWRIWDANQVQALLATQPHVRQGIPGLLTPGDIFANLADIFDVLPSKNVEHGLRAHARTALVGEGNIYFDEAGSADMSAMPLHEVVIDLPVTVTSGQAGRRQLLRHVIGHAEQVLKPSLTTQEGPRHIVVAGAPGNGKTTVTRFLVQAYRSAFVSGATDLGADHQRVIAGTSEALRRMRVTPPLNRRWPMRVDLAEYAQTRGSDEDSSLLRFIAEKVSNLSELGKVTPSSLLSWMKQWPWLLVLDGLDEVTEPSIRKRLIERVTELVSNADGDDCDLLLVLTTRPVGYAENIAPDHFDRIDLDYLEPDEAVGYGKRALTVWLRNDTDRIATVSERLTQAAGNDSLVGLLRTPLQVLILTVILVSSGTPNPDRYNLFWKYYETVFNRERSKRQVGFQRILQDHGPQIQQLHERVGFELQVRSEAGARSLALLTRDELRRIAWQILDDAGYKPDTQHSGLLRDVLDAATKRLVLLAPHGDDGYGFDVRSLQELMAAMHLTTGTPEAVFDRLSLAAASPHWRNTWLFAAGRLFAQPQEHQHQALVELVETADENACRRLGPICPVGPALALDIIDDGMARSLPKWRDRLMSHGLKIFEAPTPPEALGVARTLIRYADTGDDQRGLVVDALRTALGSHRTHETAALLQGMASRVMQELRVRPETRGLSAVKPGPVMPSDSAWAPESPNWADFDDELATANLSHDGAALALAAGAAVRRIDKGGGVGDEDTEAVLAVLADDDAAQVLCAALSYVADADSAVIVRLRDRVLPAVYRTPIGEVLR
jgi:hypothetical protein